MTTAPEAPRRGPAPGLLALWAGVVALVVALVLLLVSHQPSAAAASGHLHGPAQGVQVTADGAAGGAEHHRLLPDGPAGADPDHGAWSPGGGPAHDHDHETLVACTLLAALTLLALRRMQPRPVGPTAWSPSPARGRVPVVTRAVRAPRAPDLLALGISRT